MDDRIHHGQESAKQATLTFSTVLKQSDISYLKLLGSIMDFFGVKPVVAFLLGISATYAYAEVRGDLPPYFPGTSLSTTSPEPKTITLNGVVESLEDKPLEEFSIGVVKTQQFTSPKGAFQLEVPEKGQYQFLVWQPGSNTYRVYGYQKPEEKGNGQYKLPFPLGKFPTKLGFVVGTAKDVHENPIKGVVEIEGMTAPIDAQGNFTLMNIPVGKTKIRVLPNADTQQVWEEDLQIDLSGPTSREITVRR
jgi:hypothetical protein